MRGMLLSLFLSAAVLLPKVSSAQAYSLPTPPPQVSAASSAWQILGEPIFHAGSFYFPSGPSVFFDGNVMVRSGVYLGVPLYADTTLEPYSRVLVPIGGNVMRPYERGDAAPAGTLGSRSPWFRFDRSIGDIRDVVAMQQAAPIGPSEPLVLPETYELVATSGRLELRVAAPSAAPGPYEPATIDSIPPPVSNAGVWIEYDGARWYLSGVAATFEPERFAPIGSYDRFPVYRDTTTPGAADTIYVSVVQDGPVAPYTRR